MSKRLPESKYTIHLIPHAHLDPIWLWPWTAGLDEAIATCHTACNLLDCHNDLTFNMGDAWVLEQVERTDPETFSRIRANIQSSRWDLSGGWYVQPDCNFPLAESVTRNIQLGLEYLNSRFGCTPTVALNVDSFGHASALPTLMRDVGQTSYVMMRPQEHEMAIPKRIFRWRDPATGKEVVTFRIAGSYSSPRGVTLEHVAASLKDLPSGVFHTMCFVGVGDHGGGSTEAIIEWCRAHENAVDGAQLVFSTPTRFFEAISGQVVNLPIVDGELQYHAIGCYSVEGRLKRSFRHTEHLVLQSERLASLDPTPPAESTVRRNEAWRALCFHQFHDTIGGACAPTAYSYVHADLGGAAAEAERQCAYAFRRLMLQQLGDDPLQRIALFNASPYPFEGFIEIEPWFEFHRWQETWSLREADGSLVDCQLIDGEVNGVPIDRILINVRMAPDELRVIRVDRDRPPEALVANPASVNTDRLTNVAGVAVHYEDSGVSRLSFGLTESSIPAPKLMLCDDHSDTWSHGLDCFANGFHELATWSSVLVSDRGSLMSSCMLTGNIGQSTVRAEWRVYAAAPYIELRLAIDWNEQHKLLMLSWPTPSEVIARVDGTMGGCIERPINEREYPLRDWVRMRLKDGRDQAVVCPDTFSLHVEPHGIGLTLLRSPVLAHHDANPEVSLRRRYSDRGEHTLRFQFLRQAELLPMALDEMASAMHRPPLFADLTRGMPSRQKRGNPIRKR